MLQAPWYKDAVIYELHVRSFYDSNGDGMGDFAGLTRKLDYLQDLGVDAIWLLPFYPSPWRDDGYDISDYRGVHPAYGTLRDFRRFLSEAHRRDLRVITELVINHTSSQHPWFERSRRAKPGTSAREFYVWSDSPGRFPDARVIFSDFETSNWSWDPIAQSYYWHRFFSHQPDLNFDNPDVRAAILEALDFWLGMGIDGLRLDAVPYLYERDGTNCENLPETHAFLKELRSYVDARYDDRMLLAEANQWPEDAVLYFGNGDECHMAFHFPLMPRLFMSARMEDSFPVIDILDQTPGIPESAQWCIFLRNHDELTLEMVTDEERDYMHRVYAEDPHHRVNLGIRRRLAPLLGNDRRKLELLNVLLFSMPGTPVIYYGDEIGMGDNVYLGDRNGVRTPMHWTPDRNAGFSQANPQKLYLPVIVDPEYHYEQSNVETQQGNPSSLVWWMKRLIAVRRRYRAFSRGSIRFIPSSDPRVLAFVREYGDERMLVVVNFSRYSRSADLQLQEYAGTLPQEVFSQEYFPPITERPYPVMIGSSDYYWFALRVDPAETRPVDVDLPVVSIRAPDWERLVPATMKTLERSVLPRFISAAERNSAGGKQVRRARVVDHVALPRDASGRLLFVRVEYGDEASELLVIPLVRIGPLLAQPFLDEFPTLVAAIIDERAGGGLLHAGEASPAFRVALLDLFASRRRITSLRGELVVRRGTGSGSLVRAVDEGVQSRFSGAGEDESQMTFGDVLELKLYRTVEHGPHPEVELLQRLDQRRARTSVPACAAVLEYVVPGKDPAPIAIATARAFFQSDGRQFVESAIQRYLENVFSLPEEARAAVSGGGARAVVRELIGSLFLEMAELLGTRAGELHTALAAVDDQSFAVEPFSKLYQRAAYQNLRNSVRRAVSAARRMGRGAGVVPAGRLLEFADAESRMLELGLAMTDHRIDGGKTRIHGNLGLDTVLFTGRDFVLTGPGGGTDRSRSERRLKYNALRDVASLMQSLQTAVVAGLSRWAGMTGGDNDVLEPWMAVWYRTVVERLLASYFQVVDGASFVPADEGDRHLLIRFFLLERSVREIASGGGADVSSALPELLDASLRSVRVALDTSDAAPGS